MLESIPKALPNAVAATMTCLNPKASLDRVSFAEDAGSVVVIKWQVEERGAASQQLNDHVKHQMSEELPSWTRQNRHAVFGFVEACYLIFE